MSDWAEPDRIEPTTGIRMPRSRLEAFSDGVFAIAATLLVIDVQLPEVLVRPLGQELASMWPTYAAYALSFAVIGIMWVNHHATFDRVALVDRTLLFCNLLLLGVVAFIPFPTAVLARYLKTGVNADSRTAAVLYSVVLLAASLAFALTWAYLDRHRELLRTDIEAHASRTAVTRALVGAVVYLLTIPVALLNPYLAFAVFAALTVFYVFAERPARSKRG
jgi:uncharacterized membrane protein